eukprot:1694950-Prymnesium_polylepis.1
MLNCGRARAPAAAHREAEGRLLAEVDSKASSRPPVLGWRGLGGAAKGAKGLTAFRTINGTATAHGGNSEHAATCAARVHHTPGHRQHQTCRRPGWMGS